MFGSVEWKRSRSKAGRSICSGHFLLKAEGGCCLLYHAGNPGLKTDALSRNRAFDFYGFTEHLHLQSICFCCAYKNLDVTWTAWKRNPSNGYIYFKVYIKNSKDVQKDIRLYRFRLYWFMCTLYDMTNITELLCTQFVSGNNLSHSECYLWYIF